MAEFAHALSWMIISPIAVITDVIAIVIIAHYYPFFHGTDVMLTSLLSAMALNAFLVLPIPSFLGLKEMAWNPSLCLGYVWCFITFRLAQVMSLCGMSIHWSAILKVSAERKNYFSTKYLKLGTVLIWIISSIVGSLPLIGAANADFNKSDKCEFLPSNLGIGFAVFFLVGIVASMFVCVICAFDATFLIRHMKQVAKVKYQAGRFHVPDKSTDVPTQGNCSVSERYQRLNFAWDLSCFVLLVIALCFLGNHFPYAVIQGIQIFHPVDREILETVTLWLVALESLFLPHTLWFFSRRYRHALTYVWQVYLLRRKDVEEEDPASCMLQSYTQKDKDRVIPSRPQSRIGQNGGLVSASGTLRSIRSEMNPNTNGRPAISTVTSAFTDISNRTTPPQNGIIQGEVYVENQNYNERGVDASMPVIETLKPVRRSKTPERKESEKIKRTYEPDTLGATSKDTNMPGKQSVQRTSSNSSRRDWKDKIKKNHLPPIFVNEAFDGEDHGGVSERREKARRALYQASGHSELSTSLHYYLSSDYHPDYLTESLPRHKLTISTESDSTGINEPYDDNDISDILDKSFERTSSKRSDKRANEAEINNIKPMPILQRPYLRTFISPNAVEKEDSFESESISGSDSCHIPSSVRGLREDNEIMFESGTLPLDDINDGFRSGHNSGMKGSKIAIPPKNATRDTVDITQANYTLNYAEQIRARAKSPIYDSLGVVETSTSFSKQNNDANSVINSLASTGSFTISHVPSSQSDTESVTLTPRTSKTSASDSVNNGDDEMNDSSESNSSVTLSPYKEETRRRPWMENIDDEDGDVLAMQMQEPLVHDSDTDTLKASQDSFDRLGFSYDARESGASTPVSSIFDDETDRGFEDALKLRINPTMSGYSGIGLCFESIKEEPEDLTSSGSNPFLDDATSDEFKTQAVVSKRPNSNSSSQSSKSLSENVVSSNNQYEFPQSNDTIRPRINTPTVIATDVGVIFDDSGFTSAVDHINTSDSSNQQEGLPSGKLLPWPDSDDNIKDADLSFESDFSQHSGLDKISECDRDSVGRTPILHGDNNSNKSAKLTNVVVKTGSKPKPVRTQKPIISPQLGRKPANIYVQGIKSTERRMPLRTKSFEETSEGKSKRSAIVRSGSMDGPTPTVKPAYF